MSQRSIWGATLRKAVALQWGAVVGLAMIAGVFGANAALSLLGGGVAVVLPSTALAVWLSPRMRSADPGVATALMVAEGLKLMATTALLLLVVVGMGSTLVWPGMLLGIVTALVAQWLSLWVTRRY